MVNRRNPKYRERVYAIVRRIPSGRVMTYGQIAELLGDGYTPRTVGFCMHSSPEGTPWHRVINAQGKFRPAGLFCHTTNNNACSNTKA